MLDLVMNVPGVKFVISCMTGLIKARGQTGYHPGFAFFIVSTSDKEREYFAIAHDNNIDVDLKKITTSANKSEPGVYYLQQLKMIVKVFVLLFYIVFVYVRFKWRSILYPLPI
ncbi:MAG: hypothetical protein AAFY76_26345 [Cyanobacteria bacterium J06649_11]